MGNTSNRDQWAARERLRLVERVAWWRGAVNRGNVREVFGISAAQASADLQAYLELNPGALAYNLTTKRYEASPEMRCVLHVPSLGEAVRTFLGEGAPLSPPVKAEGEGGVVDCFVPPVRRASESVERRVFRAVDGARRLGIRYKSVSSGRTAQRVIAPHAFGYDGYRWHARAWCFENGDYRDFVLSRIERADWPDGPVPEGIPTDRDWETFDELVLEPNPALSPEQRRAIAWDFGMSEGVLRLRVRRAMRTYTLMHLRLQPEGMAVLPPFLVPVAKPRGRGK